MRKPRVFNLEPPILSYMIVLPTRQKLIRRRDALYERLYSILECCHYQQVEDCMRKIHGINLRLRTYFIREHEPKEVFNDEEENEENRVKAKNPFTINTI